jgi:putative heme-binding domain-containing protein
MVELSQRKDLKEIASWWLNNRKGNDWKGFEVDKILKARGLYDPNQVKLTASDFPAEPVGAQPLSSVETIAKLKGDAKRGAAAVAVCYSCHRIGDQGIEYGPNLTTYGRQQSAEAIIQAIAQPSAAISHGYEGSRLVTKDGLVLTGMVLTQGDPTMIKGVGGAIQTVPADRIKSVEKLEKSLMYSPAMLGLTDQGVADLTAYLQSL